MVGGRFRYLLGKQLCNRLVRVAKSRGGKLWYRKFSRPSIIGKEVLVGIRGDLVFTLGVQDGRGNLPSITWSGQRPSLSPIW